MTPRGVKTAAGTTHAATQRREAHVRCGTTRKNTARTSAEGESCVRKRGRGRGGMGVGQAYTRSGSEEDVEEKKKMMEEEESVRMQKQGDVVYSIRKRSVYDASPSSRVGQQPIFPRRIVLLRHAESTGNVDKKVFESTPDWTIGLTDNGIGHAELTGRSLRSLLEEEDGPEWNCQREERRQQDKTDDDAETIATQLRSMSNDEDADSDDGGGGSSSNEEDRSSGEWNGTLDRFFERNKRYTDISPYSLFFFSSPYKRSQQTLRHVCKSFPDDVIVKKVEDPQLREQDFGNFQSTENMRRLIMPERQRFGRFFYRFPNGGESGADVYDRITIFEDHLVRDIETGRFPSNCTIVIVTHGLTLRLFLMRWFHWSVEEFERVYNPPHCKPIILEKFKSGLDGHVKTCYRISAGSRSVIRYQEAGNEDQILPPTMCETD